jgi:RNA 2',3'-cyclic 3'-phosphodiesterase
VTGATAGEQRSAGHGPARRLFFALWPDDAARRGLAAAVRELVPPGAGRPQRPDQWHVTLEFLGDIPESRLPAVLDAGAAASAVASACEVDFDRLEHWKRPQVLCLVASSIPQPLAALIESLRAELQVRGFTPEARPFKAHVTLARRVARPPALAPVKPLRWPVRGFALVQSVTEPAGSRYLQIATWPPGP